MSRTELIREALLNTIKMQYNSAVDQHNAEGDGDPLKKLASFRDVLATPETAHFAHQLLHTDIFNTPKTNDVGLWIQLQRNELQDMARAKIE